jgi:hypothetical protein
MIDCIVLTIAEATALRTRLEKVGNALVEIHAALSTRKTRKAKSEPTAKAAKGKDAGKRRGRPPKSEAAAPTRKGPGRPPKAAAAPAAGDEI